MLIDCCKYLLVQYNMILLAEVGYPLFLKILLIIGNHEFANIVVSLRSLESLAKYGYMLVPLRCCIGCGR